MSTTDATLVSRLNDADLLARDAERRAQLVASRVTDSAAREREYRIALAAHGKNSPEAAACRYLYLEAMAEYLKAHRALISDQLV
jgi:hypothetical protein